MNQTKSLVEHLAELRDLLIVIEQGGEKTPDVLYKLAVEKSQTITAIVEQKRIDADAPQVVVPAEYALLLDENSNVANESEDTIVAEHEPEIDDRDTVGEGDEGAVEETTVLDEDVFIDDAMMVVGGDEQENSVQLDEVVPAESDNESSLSNTEDFVADAEEETPTIEIDVLDLDVTEETSIDLSTTEVENSDIMGNDLEIMTDEVEVADEDYVEETEFVDSDDTEDGGIIFVDDEPEIMEEESESVDDMDERELYNRGEPMESEPSVLTVGDMMSARRAKELRKALGLNDRFRFRRELFGNSDVNMNDTLNLIDTMADYAEARDYLINDLGWSADEPVVKEFLELVSLHFKS